MVDPPWSKSSSSIFAVGIGAVAIVIILLVVLVVILLTRAPPKGADDAAPAVPPHTDDDEDEEDDEVALITTPVLQEAAAAAPRTVVRTQRGVPQPGLMRPNLQLGSGDSGTTHSSKNATLAPSSEGPQDPMFQPMDE